MRVCIVFVCTCVLTRVHVLSGADWRRQGGAPPDAPVEPDGARGRGLRGGGALGAGLRHHAAPPGGRPQSGAGLGLLHLPRSDRPAR